MVIRGRWSTGTQRTFNFLVSYRTSFWVVVLGRSVHRDVTVLLACNIK